MIHLLASGRLLSGRAGVRYGYVLLCTGRATGNPNKVTRWSADVTCKACLRKLRRADQPPLLKRPGGGWATRTPE